MKPEGNMVGNCMGLNEEPQRLIAYKDEVQAGSIAAHLINTIPNRHQSFLHGNLDFFRHESGKR
jgi:hypothetical protein